MTHPSTSRRPVSDYLFPLLTLLLIIISCLRYRIGIDSVMQEIMYHHSLADYSIAHWQKSDLEPSAFLLFVTLRHLGVPWWIVQSMQAILVIGSAAYIIRRYATRRLLAMTLFGALLWLRVVPEGFWEGIAIGIWLPSIPLLQRGRHLPYILLTLLAATFHYAALLLLLLPPLISICSRIRTWTSLSPRLRALCIISGVVMAAGAGYAINPIISLCSHLPLPESLSRMTLHYTDSRYLAANLNLHGILGQILIWILPTLFALIIGETPTRHHDGQWAIRFIAWLAIIAYAIGIQAPVIGRYGNYFTLFAFIIVADWQIISNFTIDKVSLYTLRFVWCTLICTACAVRIYTLMATDPEVPQAKAYMIYWPYHTILDKGTTPMREALLDAHLFL